MKTLTWSEEKRLKALARAKGFKLVDQNGCAWEVSSPTGLDACFCVYCEERWEECQCSERRSLMEGVQVGWKVVESHWRGLHSAALPWGAAGDVQYKVDRWTFPARGCGPLAVWKSKAEAEAFAEGEEGRIVLPCEYIPSPATVLWRTVELSNDVPEVITEGDLPEGTILAAAVCCHAASWR